MSKPIIPKTGLAGLFENWRSDMMAALSVSLVSLPLSLGIALACGITPIAGVFSAIVGGIVTTIYRGTYVAVNGPAAGLIAVIITSIAALNDGTPQTWNYVLAAIVVSGAIQVLMGLFKWGRFVEVVHPTVVHGILAAIGIIIFAKQIHYTLDTDFSREDSIPVTLWSAIQQLPDANPFVVIISLVGLALLIFHSKMSYKLFHFLPAPVWVLVLSIPLVYLFNFFEPHTESFLGKSFEVGPDLLISIPDNVFEAILFLDFSKMHTWPFWTSVISITLIASIESLALAKAIDQLDPYKRKTHLNKDLIGIGMATMVSGAIGGLPIINVIVRTTVNVHNHAKTRWSNFFNGAYLLIFVFILTPFIMKIPLAALSILLVYTGYKLAAPRNFKRVYKQGVEQLLFFTSTLLIALFTDVLIGIFGGMAVVLCTHMLLAKVSPLRFFQLVFHSDTTVVHTDGEFHMAKIKGVANFLSLIHLEKKLSRITKGQKVQLDFSRAILVDFAVMEYVRNFQRKYEEGGGKIKITGLEQHSSTSDHPHALKLLPSLQHKKSVREFEMAALARKNDWEFKFSHPTGIADIQSFYFFKNKLISQKRNVIQPPTDDWEIFDVKFDEGAYLSAEEYKTTLGLINFDFELPKFTFELRTFTDRLIPWGKLHDIDYNIYPSFSDRYVVKVDDPKAMDTFVTQGLIDLMEYSDMIHHLECNGSSILVFLDRFKLAPMENIGEIITFEQQLREIVLKSRNKVASSS